MKRKLVLSTVILLLFLTTGAVLWSLYGEIRSRTIQDFNSIQQRLAQQASLGIQQCLGHLLADMKYLAANDDVIHLNQKGKILLNRYLETHPDVIAAIGTTSLQGVISYSYPDTFMIGKNVGHQAHNREFISNPRPYLGDVFMAIEGYQTCKLFVPVSKNGRIIGALDILLNFDKLSQKYVGDIKLGDGGYAWMLSRDGTELYSPVPGHVGQNIRKTSKAFPSVLKLADKMMAGESGSGTYYYNAIADRKTETKLKHVYYQKITLFDNFWSIAVATPEEQILSSLTSFNRKIILLFVIFAFIFAASIVAGFYVISLRGREAQLKGLNRKIESSKRDLELVIESSPSGIGLLEEDGAISMVNKRFIEIFGFTGNEVPTITEWSEKAYPDPEYRQALLEIWNKKLVVLKENGGSEIMENVLITTRSGDVRNVDIIFSYTKGHIITIFNDITERIEATRQQYKLREELERSRKMESIGFLAGGVAHDLNNILLGLVTYPDMIIRKLAEDDPLRNHIISIRKSGERAAAIVADLLSLARGVARKAESINVDELCDDIMKSPECERFRHDFSIEGIALDVKDTGLFVQGSRSQLRKSILNLLVNAAEASHENAAVHLTVEREDLDSDKVLYETVNQGSYVKIIITNHGEQIPQNQLKRIFEPFYSTKVRGRSGSGLGLAVVWMTVKDHRGFVDVVSGNNETSFTLYLPLLTAGMESGREDASSLSPTGNQEMILIVDDEPIQREIASEILSQLNYNTISVGSGEEAVDYARENTVDLFLLDMIMPGGMNGRETFEKIINFKPDARAIIVSGFSYSEETDRVLGMGEVIFLQKPYTFNELGTAVAEMLTTSSGNNE